MSTVVPFALSIMLGSLGASLLGHYARRVRAWVLYDRVLPCKWHGWARYAVLKPLEWLVR